MFRSAIAIEPSIGRAFQLALSRRTRDTSNIHWSDARDSRFTDFGHCIGKSAIRQLRTKCLRDLPALACGWGSAYDATRRIDANANPAGSNANPAGSNANPAGSDANCADSDANPGK
jgi:hypothetical protein